MRLTTPMVWLCMAALSSGAQAQMPSNADIAKLISDVSKQLQSVTAENRSLRDRIAALEGREEMASKVPTVDEVADFILANRKDQLIFAESASASDVASVLIRDHKDQLPPGKDATAPVGMVAAFYLDMPLAVAPDKELDDPCPKPGWTRFNEANGRFLLGVGKGPLKKRAIPKVTGGEEENTLTVEQMPLHRHGISDKGADTKVIHPGRPLDGKNHVGVTSLDENGSLKSANTYAVGGPKRSDRKTELGEAAPHNNMPPYIALYFCQFTGQKEG